MVGHVFGNPHIEFVQLTFTEPSCVLVSDGPLVRVPLGIALQVNTNSCLLSVTGCHAFQAPEKKPHDVLSFSSSRLSLPEGVDRR